MRANVLVVDNQDEQPPLATSVTNSHPPAAVADGTGEATNHSVNTNGRNNPEELRYKRECVILCYSVQKSKEIAIHHGKDSRVLGAYLRESGMMLLGDLRRARNK